MSVILVAEEDAGSAELIANALKSEGWSVETVGSRTAALHAAATRQPDLLLASTTLPEAASLLAAFSLRRGGPGSIALVPTSFAAQATAEDYQADDLLAKPCEVTALRRAVRHGLEAGSTPAEESPGAPDTDSPEVEPATPGGQQLTSADIFGDVLAEVEAEAERAKGARRERARTRRGQAEEIERRLEETLSGVFPVGGKRKQAEGPAAPAPAATAAAPAAQSSRRPNLPSANEIDDLLDKTLSSLDLPSPRRRPKAARRASKPASKPAPAPDILAPPPEPTPEAPPEAPTPAPSRPPAEEPAVAVPPAVSPPVAAAPEVEPSPMPPRPPQEALKTQRLPVVTDPRELLGPAASAPEGPTQRLPVSTDGPGLVAPEHRDAGMPEHRTAGRASGKTFGEYTLLERVAVGGMAEVWRARRRGVEGFQKTVAIKKILAHLTDSPDFVNMFIDEAKLAAQLNHHNIIQIYDLGKVGDDFFIAMEYVDGKDLRSILNAAKETGQPTPTGLALLIVGALARALDYAHRKRDFEDRDLALVHRDVSPQNVLISYEGEIKLCDFGIVKAVSKASTTQMGALKGKLQYMSPEQAWGRSVDSRSDIFSLGSVLFEVLTGTKLFAGDSEIGVLDAVRECRVRSPREIVPSIPEEVEHVLRRALAKSPEDRYQTAGEMEHDLKSILDGISPTPSLKDLAAYLDTLFRRPASGDGAPQPVGRTPVGRTPSGRTPVGQTPEVRTPATGSAAGSAAMATPSAVEPPQERRTGDRRSNDRRTGDHRAGTPAPQPAAVQAPAVPPFWEPSAEETEAGESEAWPAEVPETGSSEPTAPGSPDGARGGKRLLAAAAVIAVILAGVGWLLFRGPSSSDSTPAPPPPIASPTATEPAATPGPRTAAGPAGPEAAPPPAGDLVEGATGGPATGGPATGGPATGDPATGDPATGDPATGADPFPADLEEMVAEEVLKRREQMERDFEAKKRRLEEEIAKTREAEPEDESGGGGDGDGGGEVP